MDRNDSLTSLQINKLYHQWTTILLALALWGMSVMACIISTSPSKSIHQVSEADLVGIWEAHYSGCGGVEFLVIKYEETYQQIFEDTSGYLYISEIFKWHLEPSASGRLFVRFEKGRYFPQGPEFAGLRGTDPFDHNLLYSFYDPEDDSSVHMDNELILEVFPSHNPKGITLMQFSADIDSGVEYFTPVIP